MGRNISLLFLLFSILFMLITDNMIKKGRFLEVKTILIVKALGAIFLFISIGLLIATS